MKQKKALIKLAQVRLAINHVLRQRMVKKADTIKQNPPGLDIAPSDLREHKYWEHPVLEPDEGVFRPGMPYRPIGWKGPIDTNNPAYQGLMFRDTIGPLWNRGMRYWGNQLGKKWNQWYERRARYLDTFTEEERKKASDDFEKTFPEPKFYDLPEGLLMNTPYKSPFGNPVYNHNGRIVP